MRRPFCPVCGDEVAGIPVRCPQCRVLYHHDCYEYLGRCAIYGCAPVPATVRPSAVSFSPPGPREPFLRVAGVALIRTAIVMALGVLGLVPTILAQSVGFIGPYTLLSVVAALCAFCYRGSGTEGDEERPARSGAVGYMILSILICGAATPLWALFLGSSALLGVVFFALGSVQWSMATRAAAALPEPARRLQLK